MRSTKLLYFTALLSADCTSLYYYELTLYFTAPDAEHPNVVKNGEEHSFALTYTVLHYTALHYTARYCTALHYTALLLTALHSSSMHCSFVI